MIKKLIKPLLKVAYIGIANDGNKAHINTRYIKNEKVVKEEVMEFDLVGGRPSQQMIDYIEKVDRGSSYFYIAMILNSINQGSVPSTDLECFHKLGVDTSNISTITKDNKWTVYSSNYDIEEIERNFSDTAGVDFIFPTEAVIDYLREEGNENEAYLLYCNSSASLSIYNNNILTYSSHFIFGNDEEIISDGEDTEVSDLLEDMLVADDIFEEIVELDSINDDFDTIEDLNEFVAEGDSLDFDASEPISETDSFSMPESAEPYGFLEEDEADGDLRRDMLLLEFVKNSINDFYKNDNLPSEFISKATIIDTHGVAKGVARFIKEELYIDAEVIEIDLAKTICDMAIEEAKE